MTMATAHTCKVDRSPDTGSLVACTCGLALGPFTDHSTALSAAREHRQVVERQARADHQRERRRQAAR